MAVYGPRRPAPAAALAHEPVGQAPEVADLDDHLVARPQPRLVRPALGDALRSAGRDHVARLQRPVFADVADQLGHAEDHVGRAGVLPRSAVDRALDPERLRIPHLARTDQVRAQRQEAIERLAEKPLRAAELQVPRAEVVAVAVAPDE